MKPSLAVCALMVITCGECRTPNPSPATQTAAVPQPAQPSAPVAKRASTPEQCLDCRGVWARQGLAQIESCNCRTTDAGKRCRGRAECQGKCVVADNPEREVTEPGPPPKGYFWGHCSEFVQFFGCARLLIDSTTGPVPLDEPPTTLCAD